MVSLFDAGPQRRTREVPHQLARRVGIRAREVAEMNTPVNTGKLRSAWKLTPVVKIKALLGEGHRITLVNDTEYAAWVEHGTGLWGPKHRPYVITPKEPGGMLAWKDPKTGQWIRAKKVIHPGSPGNHMLAIAMHVAEHEFENVFGPRVLADWAHDIEGMAD